MWREYVTLSLGGGSFSLKQKYRDQEREEKCDVLVTAAVGGRSTHFTALLFQHAGQ